MYKAKHETIVIIVGISIVFLFILGMLNQIYDPLANYTFSHKYYPKRQIGDFTVPKRASPIEEDFGKFAMKVSHVEKKTDGCYFDGIDNLSYISPKKIRGDYRISTILLINGGQCAIGLNDTIVKVTANSFEIKKAEATLWTQDVPGKGEIRITFERHIDAHYVAIDSEQEGFSKILNVQMPEKPNVVVELKNDFKGKIGPWIW